MFSHAFEFLQFLWKNFCVFSFPPAAWCEIIFERNKLTTIRTEASLVKWDLMIFPYKLTKSVSNDLQFLSVIGTIIFALRCSLQCSDCQSHGFHAHASVTAQHRSLQTINACGCLCCLVACCTHAGYTLYVTRIHSDCRVTLHQILIGDAFRAGYRSLRSRSWPIGHLKGKKAK